MIKEIQQDTQSCNHEQNERHVYVTNLQCTISQWLIFSVQFGLVWFGSLGQCFNVLYTNAIRMPSRQKNKNTVVIEAKRREKNPCRLERLFYDCMKLKELDFYGSPGLFSSSINMISYVNWSM